MLGNLENCALKFLVQLRQQWANLVITSKFKFSNQHSCENFCALKILWYVYCSMLSAILAWGVAIQPANHLSAKSSALGLIKLLQRSQSHARAPFLQAPCLEGGGKCH